jgi:hypothetical protein
MRVWGNVWGNETFAPQDICEYSFPFLGFEPMLYLRTESLFNPPIRFLDVGGVYLQSKWDEIFILGGAVYATGEDMKRTEFVDYFEREEIDIEERFTLQARDDLSDRQLTLLEGNEGLYDYVQSPFTSLSSYTPDDLPTYLSLGEVSVCVDGQWYGIRTEENIGGSRRSGLFWDFGIFSRQAAGINTKQDTIDETKVKPVYAYCLEMRNPDNSNRQITYGMVYKDKHYKTDEYAGDGSWDVIIPEASQVKDQNGNSVVAKKYVRVGRREVYIKNKVR